MLFNPHAHPKMSAQRVIGLMAFIFVILVWFGISASGLVSSNKLPSPLDVIHAFSYLIYDNGKSMLFDATIASVGRIVTAAALVLLIGIPVGIVMGSSPIINAALSPLVDPFRSAPIVAMLPILVMWLGIGEEMKITFLFLGSVVYLIPLVRDAMRSVPYAYWECLKDLGATDIECIQRAVLPIAMPRIFDAAIVSTSILWTYITVAEYVNADSGLGMLIQNARRFSAMDQVFAGVITIVVLALLTHTLLTKLRDRLYFWEGTQ
jgi:ABC-type nitrate/sulfonate/bicarbonate transport system permease component